MTTIVTQDKNGKACFHEMNYFGLFVFSAKRLKWSQKEIKKQAKEFLEIFDDHDFELDENAKNLIENLNRILEEG